MPLLLETTWNDDVVWSRDSALASVYGLYTDSRSKVIKGGNHAFSKNNSKIRHDGMDGSCDLKIVKTHANNSKEVIMRSLRGHKRS